jgi:hypothetical protein
MRPTGLFCNQHCGLVKRPHVFWKLLPFAVVIGGAPIWEEASGISDRETFTGLIFAALEAMGYEVVSVVSALKLVPIWYLFVPTPG